MMTCMINGCIHECSFSDVMNQDDDAATACDVPYHESVARIQNHLLRVEKDRK